jgi:predicted RNA-binding Zn ribbon-like protein
VKTQREAEKHRLIAGNPCLDFVNTLNGHDRLGGHEYLHDFRDLALWSRHAGILKSPETTVILGKAVQRPKLADAIFRRTIRLRETIFRIFHAVAMAREPRQEDMRRLNAAWQSAQRHVRLLPSAGRFILGWDDDPVLERIPRALTGRAVGLLTSGEVARIRACSGDACDWLFIDRSRNHQRRWCSMEECGNRAKMRRRRARTRLGGPDQILPRSSLRHSLK